MVSVKLLEIVSNPYPDLDYVLDYLLHIVDVLNGL